LPRESISGGRGSASSPRPSPPFSWKRGRKGNPTTSLHSKLNTRIEFEMNTFHRPNKAGHDLAQALPLPRENISGGRGRERSNPASQDRKPCLLLGLHGASVVIAALTTLPPWRKPLFRSSDLSQHLKANQAIERSAGAIRALLSTPTQGSRSARRGDCPCQWKDSLEAQGH